MMQEFQVKINCRKIQIYSKFSITFFLRGLPQEFLQEKDKKTLMLAAKEKENVNCINDFKAKHLLKLIFIANC